MSWQGLSASSLLFNDASESQSSSAFSRAALRTAHRYPRLGWCRLLPVHHLPRPPSSQIALRAWSYQSLDQTHAPLASGSSSDHHTERKAASKKRAARCCLLLLWVVRTVVGAHSFGDVYYLHSGCCWWVFLCARRALLCRRHRVQDGSSRSAPVAFHVAFHLPIICGRNCALWPIKIRRFSKSSPTHGPYAGEGSPTIGRVTRELLY